MSVVQQIEVFVTQMPEKKQKLVLDLVKAMFPQDDILTDEDEADIVQARIEFARGEFVRHEDINWD